MRIAEAARQLGISPGWLRELERAGRIPAAPRDINGHRRYTVADVVAIRRALYRSRLPAARREDLRAWANRQEIPWPPGIGEA